MAFNLGAFAGGLAKGGMDTYQTLEAIESQKKRDALIELQAQEARAAAEERTALKGAAASTFGQVGAPETAIPGRKLSEADVTNAYAIDQGDPTAVAPKAYTQAQAEADYLSKVRGISPERALDVEAKQMQIQSGRREQKFDQDFDAERTKWNQQTTDLMSKFDTALTQDGANGVVREIGPEFKKITGKSIALVGNDIVVGTGKDAEKIPAKDLRGAFESAMTQHYTQGFADTLVKKGMFKNANEAITYQLKRGELNVAERGAAVGERGAAVKEARLPFENAKDAAYAGYLGGGGKGGVGGTAGKAATAQQMVDDGTAPDLATAYRIMAAKGATPAVDAQWGKLEEKLAGATPAELAVQKEAFYARNGYAPATLAASITSGVKPDGKKWSPEDAKKVVADFNAKYPNSKINMADLTWVKSKDKAETSKPDSAIPAKGKGSSNFYSSEAAAARKAERVARDAAVAEEERKKREVADAESAKMRSAIAADFNSKYGR
jgi:hypothetical protein